MWCSPLFHGFAGGFWIMPIIGLIMMLVFLTFFLRLLSGRDRWFGTGHGPTSGGGGTDTPAAIVRRRYARGEISREELDEMLQVLEDRPE